MSSRVFSLSPHVKAGERDGKILMGKVVGMPAGGDQSPSPRKESTPGYFKAAGRVYQPRKGIDYFINAFSFLGVHRGLERGELHFFRHGKHPQGLKVSGGNLGLNENRFPFLLPPRTFALLPLLFCLTPFLLLPGSHFPGPFLLLEIAASTPFVNQP